MKVKYLEEYHLANAMLPDAALYIRPRLYYNVKPYRPSRFRTDSIFWDGSL
jgi:hypothetical protein